MTRPSSEERIRALAAELTPVRPIPALAAVIGAAALLCLLAVAAEGMFGADHPVRTDSAWSDPSWLALLGGVAALALGALGGALASGVPGREAAERLGDRVALAGLLLALAGGLYGVARAPVSTPPAQLEASLYCCARAFALGLGSAAVAFAFLARAVPRSAWLAAALALAGGIGLGAIVVQLTCPSASAAHQLLGHALAPVLAALLFGLPGAALLRRFSSRAR